MLSKYQSLCYRIFGRRASKSTQIEYVKRAIEKAFMEVRPEAYISFAWMNGLLGGIVGIVLVILYLFVLPSFVTLPAKLLAIVIPSPILLGALAYFITMMIPESRANARRTILFNSIKACTRMIIPMPSVKLFLPFLANE